MNRCVQMIASSEWIQEANKYGIISYGGEGQHQERRTFGKFPKGPSPISLKIESASILLTYSVFDILACPAAIVGWLHSPAPQSRIGGDLNRAGAITVSFCPCPKGVSLISFAFHCS